MMHHQSNNKLASVAPPATPNHDKNDSSSRKKIPMPRSPSIPISSNKHKRSDSEDEENRMDSMATDDRDYAMFHRIVGGMQASQRQTRDCRWRLANHLSLQRVYQARNEEEQGCFVSPKRPFRLPPAKLCLLDQTTVVSVMTTHFQHHHHHHHHHHHNDNNAEVMTFALEM